MNYVSRRLDAMFLPCSPAGRSLTIAAGIESLGGGVFLASFAMYFVGVVGIAEGEVAFANTLAGAIALLGLVPIARLADRLGTVRVFIALLVLRGIGHCFYVFVSEFKGLLLLMVILALGDRACSPIKQTVVTEFVGGKDGTRTNASIRAVKNIGRTLGLLLAASALATGQPSVFTVLLLVNGLSYFVAAAMVRRAVHQAPAVVAPTAPASDRTAATTARVRSPFRDRWFMVFTLSNGVLWLYETVLMVLLPIWVIKHTAVPAGWVPVFMAVNTVLTVLLQVYVARFAEGALAANRLLTVSGALFAVSCGLFAIGQAVPGAIAVLAVLAAVVVLSVAENLHAVATWELSAELSPQGAATRYLGAFHLASAGQKVVGPTLLVAVLMPAGLIAWPVLAGAFGTAAVFSRTAANRCLAERQGRTVHRTASPALLSPVGFAVPCMAWRCW